MEISEMLLAGLNPSEELLEQVENLVAAAPASMLRRLESLADFSQLNLSERLQTGREARAFIQEVAEEFESAGESKETLRQRGFKVLDDAEARGDLTDEDRRELENIHRAAAELQRQCISHNEIADSE